MELEQVWPEVQKELASRGFMVFPSPPVNMDQSGSSAPSPLAMWPPDRTLEEFLDLAVALSMRLVYAWEWRFTEQDLDDVMGEWDQASESASEARPPRRRVAGYVGRITSINVQFTYGGVVHGWEQHAPWKAELESLRPPAVDADSDTEGWDQTIRRLNRDFGDKREAWVDRLARDDAFQRTSFGRAKTEVVLRAIPELSEAASREGVDIIASSATRSFAREIGADAWARYKSVIIPERERELARQGRELMARGMSRTEAAGRLGMGKDKLGRLLAQYPDGD